MKFISAFFNHMISPYTRYALVRFLYRLGIAVLVRRLIIVFSQRERQNKNNVETNIEKVGKVNLNSIQLQIIEKLKFAQGYCLIISMDGLFNALLQLPIIAGLVARGLEPVILIASRASQNQIYIYRLLGVQKFAYWDDYGHATDIGRVLDELKLCRTQDDLLRLKWKSIHIGKYAVSTLMRRQRQGSIDPKDPHITAHLEVFVKKTLDHAHAALKIIETWKPQTVIFIDRGYTPEGPLFEACIQSGISPITMNAAHRDNALILKRYCIDNSNVHPVSLSGTTWNRILSMPWTDDDWRQVSSEIEHCYKSGQWYGEVATQFNTQFLEGDALREELGLDPAKRTVLIFPHIFWDATFFWGEDVFHDYEEWFRETVRIALQTPSVNWVIKIHPANVVKNLRDGTDTEFSEVKVLKEFGDIPPHVFIIPADTKISTLSLYSIGDICLTVRGTVGIEASAYGLAVVTAGTGRYDRLGFTTDVTTPEEYRNLLGSVDRLPAATAAQVELARRYAYGAFIVRPLEMASIQFAYSKSRSASLTVEISKSAVEDLFQCHDVIKIKKFLESSEQDTPY